MIVPLAAPPQRDLHHTRGVKFAISRQGAEIILKK
jgi:hypothetical protein